MVATGSDWVRRATRASTSEVLAKPLGTSWRLSRGSMPTTLSASGSEMVLVLDATRAAAHSFPQVVREFIRAHGADAERQGWQSVWIVGPSVAETRLLAGQAPPSP